MRKPFKVLTYLVLGLMAGAGFYLLWPASLGGRTTYVITHGTSMQPRFHTGDLAILHSTSSYAPGEVVTYHSDTLHVTVMHRIIARDGNRFVFKGDNNNWVDADHPTQNQLSGKLWLHIPHVGTAVREVHSPLGLASCAALLIVIPGGALRGRTRGRRRRASASRRLPRAPTSRRPRATTRLLRPTMISALLIALLAGAAGALLLIQPSRVAATRTVTIAHQPTFAYHASAPVGVTYPDGQVHTGQPVFLKLVDSVTVTVTDKVSLPPGATGTTTAQLAVALSTGSGWSSPLAVGLPMLLKDNVASSTIDLTAARRALDQLGAETGTTVNTAAIIVTAQLIFHGTIAGHVIDSAAAPSYAFTLDSQQLHPPTSKPVASPPTAITLPTTRAPGIQFAGRLWNLHTLGYGALALAGVALIIGLGCMPMVRRMRRDRIETPGILASRVIEISDAELDTVVIDVTTAAALNRVAERYDRLILHHHTETADTFIVRDENTTYRLTVPTTRPAHRLRRIA